MVDVALPDEPIEFKAVEGPGHVITLVVVGQQNDTIELAEPADHKNAGSD